MIQVTLHVSVWVEIQLSVKMSGAVERHAPRERVSWNVTTSSCNIDFWVTLHVSVWVEMTIIQTSFWQDIVTLHVSVWVEISSVMIVFWCVPVTLHVSVWVEMHVLCALIRCYNVTLHVSVWVEIPIKMADNTSVASRSTWACELKSLTTQQACEIISHAPRERVSWNIIQNISIQYIV